MIRSFSAIVPVFNKENEIVRTLESIEASIRYFDQHYDGSEPVRFEVLVVNDGSTDRTLELITSFIQTKPHYQVINHFKNLGSAAARNTGAKVSTGEILFFCDSDDLVFPEHFYLCFRVLNAATDRTRSFILQTDRGPLTVELPQQSIAMVRTSVFMQDQLHPYWKAAIENTLMQNLALRRECHEFVEGFPEAPIYKQIGCEDISYDLWIHKFFKHLKINHETVEYIRYPGNNLDRQLKKFQTPPEQYREALPLDQQELHAIRHKLEQERLTYLLDKLRQIEKSPDFLSLLNWQTLASEYITQQHYSDAIALCERAITEEPTTLSNVRNLLAVAYNNLGSSCHQKGDLAQATQHFQRAIEISPDISKTDFARIHFNVGAVLRDQEKFEQSLDYFQKALIFDPQFAEASQALPIVQYKAEAAAKGYQFSQDWFSHNIPVWRQHLSRFVNLPNLRALEIGSWEGRSTCWLLDHVLTHESARITCVDTFAGGEEHKAMNQDFLKSIEARFDFNIAKSGHPEKVRKMVGTSQEILRSLSLNSFQLVYIDGSHIASDVLEDTLLTWALMQVGSLMIFDDYGYKFADGIQEIPPKVAIDAFLNVFGSKVRLLHQGYQIILEKLAA